VLATRRRSASARRPRGFTPTQTGLGERSHLLGLGIDLATHVADIVGVMRWEQVSEVVLCGHSYGGFIISGVAEVVPALIRSIVFLDAFVPANGDTIQKLTRTAIQDAIRAALQRCDVGVPPRPAEIRAKGYHNPSFDRAFAAVQSDPSWHFHQVPCGHDVMVDMPIASPNFCCKPRPETFEP
jgi:pimeloyl-ACP methyl ester carboxylesterase